MFIAMKISVITSAYNAQATIDRTIQSVLNQTFTDFEYIIIDHGSTDKTAEIIDKYVRLDNRVKKLSIDVNSGFIGVAVNLGLKHATADYFCVIDADDAYVENFLEVMYGDTIKNKSDVSVCGYTFLDGNLDIVNRKKIDTPYFLTDKESYSNFLNNEICKFSGVMFIDVWWNKLYKKSFFEKHNLKFDESSNHVGDSFLNTMVFYNQPIVSFIPFEGLLYSTFNGESTSESYPKNRYLEYIRYADQWLNLLTKFDFSKKNFLKLGKQYFVSLHYVKLLNSKENLSNIVYELEDWHSNSIIKKCVNEFKMYERQLSETELTILLLKEKFKDNRLDVNSKFDYYYNIAGTGLNDNDFNWCVEYLFDNENWSSVSAKTIIDNIIV